MDIETYSTLALRTAPLNQSRRSNLIHAALGAGGESGEIEDHVKKVAFNGKLLDRDHLIEEVGDVMWYLNLLVSELDTTWGHALSVNIAKLETRYPDLKFDAERSLNRDLAAEKTAMESV
jgi:NTP pyrophosphatase (non-canonical NTP hydrolase)